MSVNNSHANGARTPLDHLIEQARKSWTETITTSVIRTFPQIEWLQLVSEFATAILKHKPGTKVVGFSFSLEQSKMFTNNDTHRLLTDAFGEGPLANQEGWVLEQSLFLKGAKTLHLPSALFADRLHKHRVAQAGTTPPPATTSHKRAAGGQEEQQPMNRKTPPAPKAKKAKPSPPSSLGSGPLLSPSMFDLAVLPPVDENLKALVKTFYRDYCEIQPKSKDLYPGDVWLRFWYWMNRVTRIPVKEASLAEFTRCFDKLYPQHIQLTSKIRRYQGFKIVGLPFIPVYPSRGAAEQERDDQEEGSTVSSSTHSR